jgi:stearoyl-CoA desaturase (delta-9 desaturase)
MAVPASTLESFSPRVPRRVLSPPMPAKASRAQIALTGLIVVGPFVGIALAVIAGVPVGWVDVALVVGLYAFTVLGVTAGYHRLFTHRAFVACRPLKIALAVMGSFALEGSLTSWVANHRVHHRFSDREGDPHSPHSPARRSPFRGLLHAHVGWLFRPGPETERRDIADLLVDRDLVVVSRLFPLFAFATFALPFVVGWVAVGTLAGAITALVWGGLLRIVLVHHLTWSTNSVCHVFGKRPFRSDDQSRNVAVLAALSLGESWHNAHHAFPRLARHGVDRGQLDLTALAIRGWEKLGWAHDVHWARPEVLARKRVAVASGL